MPVRSDTKMARAALGGRVLGLWLVLRPVPWRGLWQALVAVMLLACLGGCEAPSERHFSVPKWSAELPGRADPIDVMLPAHLDSLLPREPAEYVLRTTAEVPEDMRGRPLTLSIAHMPAIATLTIDGNLAVPVDVSALDSYRASGPLRWRIPEDASKDGHLQLELHVSHRFVRSAWIDSMPEISTHPLGGARLAAIDGFNTVAAIGALAAALFVSLSYGVLFLSMRDARRAAYGWFALGALCGMPYPAFVLGLTQPVLGIFDGPFLTVALVLGSIAAMAFARAYVGAPPPSRLWIGVFAAALVASVLARDPFLSVRVMGPVVVAVTLANAVAQAAFIARMRRAGKKLPAMLYAIAFAWPATVLLGLPDILAWMGQGELSGGIRTACVGILGASLYQAVALSRDHLLSLKRADDLVTELGQRVTLLQAKHREVELLNHELRRQIAARSRELAEKLARVDDDAHDLVLPARALEPGTLVEGRYRVVRELGSGGMGTVYEVERITDQKHFALKALAGNGDPQARARFAREAQIVANVHHPNVVSIVDVDLAKGGFIFLVMDLIAAGTTLHDVRRRSREVPWTLALLAQIADGMDAIHSAGIIHRDLKPGNILLSRGEDGRKPLVKITDFGISSLAPEGTPLSVIERAALEATAAAPDPREVLDPFSAVPGAASAPVRISELARRRSSAPIERDSGLVTSASSAGMIELETRRGGESDDTTAEAATNATPPTRYDGMGPNASGRASPSPPAEPRPLRGSDRPAAPAARAVRRPSSSPLTEPGVVFGTPYYMAQELTSGTKHATRASDVFSLGIIAFELFTGKRPFAEAPVTVKLGGRALPTAKPLRMECPGVPLEVALLIDRALAHEPRSRPTARELAVALREAAEAEGGTNAKADANADANADADGA